MRRTGSLCLPCTAPAGRSGSPRLSLSPVVVGKMCAVRVSGSNNNVTLDNVGSLSKNGASKMITESGRGGIDDGSWERHFSG